MISDADLCLAAQTGDRQAADQLVRRHTGLAYGIVRGLYLKGGDDSDLRQEALIALYLAVVAYRRSFGVPFVPFASVVIRRRVASALRASCRGKHAILTDARREVCLSGSDGDETVASITLVPDVAPGPAEVAEQNEQLSLLVASTRSLTDMERRSLIGIVNGHSYRDLAREHGLSEKTVDNAAVRARVKLRALLEAA